MGRHIIRSILDLDFSAGRTPFDTATWVRHANDPGNRFRADIAFNIRNRDIAGSTGNLNIAAHVTGCDGAAGGGKIGVLIDSFDQNRARRGVHFYWASKIADVLRAGRNAGIDFRVVRHLNGIGDADIPRMRKVFADSNGISPLLDGWIRNRVVEALLRVVKPNA